MIIRQNMRPKNVLWFSCVLEIDIAKISHTLDFIFRNIIFGTFHHGEHISDSGLKAVVGASQCIFVR